MTLPAFLDTHNAIVGSSGAGKTVTAKDFVAQLLDDGRHVVVIDPTGAWWGMQSNPAGDGAGFAIPVFGGNHADVPIGGGDGAALAELLETERRSAIVDLSELHDEEELRDFMLAFVERLRAKAGANLHLVIDEADEFCPQTAPDSVGYRLIRQLTWVAKRGRLKGFVLTLITQRPADISKAVLSQIQTLVAHQLVAPQDQAAIDGWLKASGSKDQRGQVMASLPGLGRGERWIYSPRLELLERGISPPLTTFDSSATPAAGEARIDPVKQGALDVAALRLAFAAAGASVPAEPAQAPAAGRAVGEALVERDARIAELEDRLRREEADGRSWKELAETRLVLIERCRAALQADGSELADPILHQAGRMTSAPFETATKCPRTGTGAAPETAVAGTSPDPHATAGETATAIIGRKALATLVGAAPAGLTEAAWATLARYTRSGGTWKTYRGKLAAAGLVEQRGALWHATAAGVAAIGADAIILPPPGPARVAHFAKALAGVGRMLDVLAKRWPHRTTAEALAADLGMTASGGTFKTYLGRLRSNALLEERGKQIRLAPALMGEST